jgi:hypothetical protein
MTTQFQSIFRRLETESVYHFLNWPNQEVKNEPGVYTIWRGNIFIYTGMATKSLSNRLKAHCRARPINGYSRDQCTMQKNKTPKLKQAA